MAEETGSEELVVLARGRKVNGGESALDNLYARNTKLVFLFDVSGSMLSFFAEGQTKLEAVKRAVAKQVTRILAKYPTADVVTFEFSSSVVGRYDGREAELLETQSLRAGGETDIANAVCHALNECAKRPSGLGLHHVVLITDGIDDGAVMVRELLGRMRELHLTLDFVWIAQPGEAMTDTVQTLRFVCAETGGEFQRVSSIADFERAFVAAAERKCLPPGLGGR